MRLVIIFLIVIQCCFLGSAYAKVLNSGLNKDDQLTSTELSTNNPNQCRQLLVGGAQTWFPYAFLDQKGKQVGIGYEVAELVLRDLNIDIKYRKPIPWRRLTEELSVGKLDLLVANYWTEQRAQRWLMTNEFASEALNIFTLKTQQFDFTQLSNLVNKRGVVTRGLALGAELEAYRSKLELRDVSGHKQGFTMLNRKRADYLILAKYSALPYLRQKQNHNIVALSQPLSQYSVRMSFSKQSRCRHLFDDFNQVLTRRVADGSVERIVNKYLAEAKMVSSSD